MGACTASVLTNEMMPSGLLILEEPTFGVDVGAKAEIYRLLQEALDRGLAVILVSSDFEEVAGISSRALVFDRGRVTAELARRELTVAGLTALASGT
jgi:ribose transport system ATP-binding protein